MDTEILPSLWILKKYIRLKEQRETNTNEARNHTTSLPLLLKTPSNKQQRILSLTPITNSFVPSIIRRANIFCELPERSPQTILTNCYSPLQRADLNIWRSGSEVNNKSRCETSSATKDGNEGIGCWITEPMLLPVSPLHGARLQ